MNEGTPIDVSRVPDMVGEKKDFRQTPGVQILLKRGFELEETDLDYRVFSMSTGGVKEWPTPSESPQGINNKLEVLIGTKKIISNGIDATEHELKVIIAPATTQNNCYTFAIYLDGQHQGGNHDDNIGEVKQQLKLAEQMAYFNVNDQTSPKNLTGFEEWEKEWEKI